MNYEELYTALEPLGKGLKGAANSTTKLQKAIAKNADMGNLTEMRKNLEAMRESVRALDAAIDAYAAQVETFDAGEYFTSGDFTKQLLDSCAQKGVDVMGEKGVYEMFPFKVRIVAETEEVFLNRKKIASYRPSYVADTVHASQEKLNKTKFNGISFMEEIAEAYTVTCLKAGARIGSAQSLTKIYKNMAPMARSRKEYDMQAFAYDLSRIYEAGPESWVTKNGTLYHFGSSRDGKSGIRVLSSTGVESFVSTLNLVNQ